MKPSGLGADPICAAESTRFFTTSTWRSQESKAGLIKKAINVETESIIRRARSQRVCDAAHAPECFAISRGKGSVVCELRYELLRHFRVWIRVSVWWSLHIWLCGFDTCKDGLGFVGFEIYCGVRTMKLRLAGGMNGTVRIASPWTYFRVGTSELRTQ